jgi:hypothetical protein
MRRHHLRKRYGHTRKYGTLTSDGRKRLLKGWVLYRGYALDPWRRPGAAKGEAWEVRAHRDGGGPGRLVGSAFGATLDEAMAKAKQLVDGRS